MNTLQKEKNGEVSLRYTVRTLRSAEKDLDRLPLAIYNRVREKIFSLEDNPRPRNLKKLSGREEYRLRAGDYRILYIVDDKIILLPLQAWGIVEKFTDNSLLNILCPTQSFFSSGLT